jgi:hypothetical protein
MLDYLIIFLIIRFFIKDNLRRGYKFSVILGIIMIVNLVLYTIIVELIKVSFAPFEGFAQFPGFDTLRYALMGAVIIDLLLIIFLRKLFIKGIFKPGLSSNKIIENLVTGSCLTYALCEVIAVYGLLLFLIAGSSFDFYLFLVPCLVFLGIFFPRHSEWEGWIKQVEERVAEI